MWKHDSLLFETHQGCLCNSSHCQRGEKAVFPPKQVCVDAAFPSSAPLKHMKSLNPPNGVLVTAVATYLRPRLRISEKWTVSISGPVITQTFLQQSAGQRRWLREQGHCLSEGEALKSCLHKGLIKRNLVSHSHDTTKHREKNEKKRAEMLECFVSEGLSWQFLCSNHNPSISVVTFKGVKLERTLRRLNGEFVKWKALRPKRGTQEAKQSEL